MAKRVTGKRLTDQCRRLGADEHGATAIEYALIAGVMAVVLVPVLLMLGQSLNDMPAWAQIAQVLTGGS